MKDLKSLICLVGVVVLLSNVSFAEEYTRKANELAIEKEIQKMDEGIAQGPYKAEWDDLKRHNEAPEWFRDAKMGIYFHWGVYAVPAHGNEWYGRAMHVKSKDSIPKEPFKQYTPSSYKYHVKTYGEPNEFAYHDFVPMFKAENFDADDWALLFKKAGAKFTGPVAEHHDGYSMWDSQLTPWNAADTGPHKDIVGLLEKAIRKQGLKFMTTFHHDRTNHWYPRIKGWPTTSDDPKLQMLYMNVPDNLFHQIWQAKLGEVIDKYQPDLIWFDGRLSLIPDQNHVKFLAYYFNTAKKWGRDVMITTKEKGYYPPEISVEDFEKGRMDHLTDYCWLSDVTISRGSWCYTNNLKIKPAYTILYTFIDIISKNGCMLLNISPMSNGVIPDDQREVLLELGSWLNINGQAVYETRPWLEYGEGPTKMKGSGHFVGKTAYCDKDIRYTRSKDNKTLYAITMGWPQSEELKLSIVKVDNAVNPNVTLLGYDKPIEFKVNDKKQPVITIPNLTENQRPCKYAYVFKLTGFQTSLQPKK